MLSVAVLVLLGAVLRIYRLDTGLWYDEIMTLIGSVRLPLGEILTHFPGNNHHPLYSVMAQASIEVFGEFPWSLRLPAAVFGIASIPMLYLIGRRVTSRVESFLAASILTFSYHHIWFSQNARGYTTLTFAVLLATYFLLSWFGDRRRSYLYAYAVVAAMGSYTHLTMVFVVVSHALVCGFELYRGRYVKLADWRPLGATFVGSALLTLLLYAPMLSDMIVFFTTQTATAEEIATPLWAALAAIRGLGVGFGILWVVGVGGVIFGIGTWSYLRDRSTALAMFLLPLPVTVGLAVVMGRPIFPRFLFFAIGFGLLITVRGTAVTGALLARRHKSLISPQNAGVCAAVLLSVAALAFSAMSLPYGYRYPKQDFGRAVEFVDGSMAAGDSVAVVGEPTTTPVRLYLGRSWPRLESTDQLAELRSRSGAVWVMYTFPAYIEAYQPDLWRTLVNECEESRQFQGTVADGNIVVRICSRPDA